MNNSEDKLIFNDEYELIEYFSKLIRHHAANKSTSKRLDDAHRYCQKYILKESWGKNVWHAILDDAIRMREDLIR
jgi:hypothetical protein